MVSCTQAEESNRADEFMSAVKQNYGERNSPGMSADCRPILVLPPTDIQVIECEQSEESTVSMMPSTRNLYRGVERNFHLKENGKSLA
nr:DNA repair protein RAD5B [Ipomoea batatas]GMD19794.1 DNA repair protein RAD5B [Ipomoea batatas]GMD49967.1 DNA repair protein RAD5B [Ipomoea batatas]GMD67908.1 DNA repair protein RAD5B [Ipomoea batatas]